jgi:hypothetical protein
VLRLIRQQAGDSTSPMLRFLLRWVLTFTPDPFTASVRRLKALRLDMGRSFRSSLEAEVGCATCTQHAPTRMHVKTALQHVISLHA